uniref:Mannose-P-dolichol utilization defect 1 protein homolog 2-like n=1 Tax=Tanacetum cinerariifolium TaxID=118510 RepID=A0A699IJU0_TANCI|nr:mannose-P-dolichol utilization defect 1 protein homolog 2-like [Tanacetum cinerariifolium]
MQTQESKIDLGSALDVVLSHALDADLVVMESNGTESGMDDTSSSSGNYITHVVDANIRPVNDQVSFAELSNMQRSEATGKSHFELVTGHQPLTPNSLAASYDGSSRTAYKTIKEWHEQADIARASLDKATKRMKKWADERRRHVEFEVGD